MSDTKPRFIWYELMTSDHDVAEAFYRAVIGWKTADAGQSGMRYTILSAGDHSMGGLMAIPAEAAGAGARPGWLGYVGVPDTDGAAKRIVESGGAIHHGPDDIPNVGRFAVVADPGGAMFQLLTPLPRADAPPPAEPGTPGLVSWHELCAGNGQEAAFRFYADQFGWETLELMDMGPAGKYRIFGVDGVPMGGMMDKPAEMPVSAWAFYVNVAGIDAAIERIKTHGGQVRMGPHEVPGTRDRGSDGTTPRPAASGFPPRDAPRGAARGRAALPRPGRGHALRARAGERLPRRLHRRPVRLRDPLHRGRGRALRSRGAPDARARSEPALPHRRAPRAGRLRGRGALAARRGALPERSGCAHPAAPGDARLRRRPRARVRQRRRPAAADFPAIAIEVSEFGEGACYDTRLRLHAVPFDERCRTHDDCAKGAHCRKPTGRCDGAGVCTARGEVCPLVVDPVCGCDEETYGNACEAGLAGVSVAAPGACDAR